MLTSLLAVGMAGTFAGMATVATQATASGRFGGRLAAVRLDSTHATATAAAPAATGAPSAAATPEPSQTPAAGPVGSPTDQESVRPAPSVGTLNTTGTAPDDQDSARVGALFNGAVGPGNHGCTASVIDSPTRNLILTAAHCAGGPGVQFAPGYRDGKAPYGSWQVTKVFTTDNWSHSGDQDEDFAILQVAPIDGRNIEDVVGGNPLGLDADLSARVRLYGYPESAELPLLCTNDTSKQDTFQRRIDCPAYSGGTSGGPWIDVATGKVIGVIGGYQQGGESDDTSYSAYFDHTIGDLFTRAVNGAS